MSGLVDRTFKDTHVGFRCGARTFCADGAGNEVPGRLGQVTTFEQQERWQQARARLCFDPADEAFWTGGLFDCLDGPGMHRSAGRLPGSAGRLRRRSAGDNPPGPLQRPDRQRRVVPIRTDHNFVCSDPIRTWRRRRCRRRVASVRGARPERACRSAVGGLPLPGGRRASRRSAPGWARPGRPSIRVVVETQAKVLDWAANQPSETGAPVDGPFELVVVVPSALGMALGGLNDGWQEPHVDWQLALFDRGACGCSTPTRGVAVHARRSSVIDVPGPGPGVRGFRQPP